MRIPILITLVTYSPWKKLDVEFTMFPFVIFQHETERLKRLGGAITCQNELQNGCHSCYWSVWQ
ncbi:MAG: hypothetical protein K0Q90_1487 [Paenibacillaceae bacterium]|jgi:hypothetical protein|nr:hypothetical protein [Paenibacillaceae bacterium]